MWDQYEYRGFMRWNLNSPIITTIVLESFVMVGGREDRALAGHESQHPGPPGRGQLADRAE